MDAKHSVAHLLGIMPVMIEGKLLQSYIGIPSCVYDANNQSQNILHYSIAHDSKYFETVTMGSVVGKVMEENFKKQQEFMVKSQEEMV